MLFARFAVQTVHVAFVVVTCAIVQQYDFNFNATFRSYNGGNISSCDWRVALRHFRKYSQTELICNRRLQYKANVVTHCLWWRHAYCDGLQVPCWIHKTSAKVSQKCERYLNKMLAFNSLAALKSCPLTVPEHVMAGVPGVAGCDVTSTWDTWSVPAP